MSTKTPQHMDATLPVEERVGQLIGQMTLAEKVAQLGSCWVYELLDGTQFSQAKAAQRLTQGLGQVTRLGGASNVHPHESAALANTIQKYLLEHTRLAIPAVIHEECCSGYMARDATIFPQAIGVGSTWEPELAEAMTAVIRQQMRAVGAHHALAPVLDVTRDPRWGRTEETFGEDPYLVARMGVAYTRGLQGEDLKNGVIATGKHFVGYGMSEGGMNWAPPHLMRRELLDTYLFPFEAAVREAGMASMMNGYHELDGIPCGANRELLTEILREAWGFDGTVVSDYFAVSQLHSYHHIAPGLKEAAAQALEAGMDVELPTTDSFGEPLRQAVEAGQIRMELLDQALTRILTQKFQLGLFENPYVDAGTVVFDTAEQRQLARKIAQQSIVLLRNENNLLPLDKNLSSIAVIGPNADTVRNLLGDYAYPAHMESLLEMKSRGTVFNTPVPDDVATVNDFIVANTVLEALKKRVAEGTQIHYAAGCGVNTTDTSGFAEAVEAARRSKVALVMVGDKAGLTDDCTSGEARDRAILDLPGVQADLVKAIYDTGTPVILVLINGRPVTLGWMSEQIPAILEAWFPGEEGADAIVDVLFGEVNPGGKLPISYPHTVGQIPVFYSHRPSGGRSHWKGEYVETSNHPLYPFGFGLSYTTFAYSNLRLSSDSVAAGDTLRVQVDVTNTGTRAGDEVVQLYTHQTVSFITRPLKELKGFKRVALEAGQTRTLTFHLPVNLLAFHDQHHQRVVAPGTVHLMVGSSSQDLPLTTTFQITGQSVPVEPAFETRVEVAS